MNNPSVLVGQNENKTVRSLLKFRPQKYKQIIQSLHNQKILFLHLLKFFQHPRP